MKVIEKMGAGRHGLCGECNHVMHSPQLCARCGAKTEPALVTTLAEVTIRIGRWEFDVFQTENGSLGFTVYEKGKGGDNPEADCSDVFVNEKLEVTSA